MDIKMFAGAILVITLAHFIRILRWQLLIGVYEKPNTRSLMRSLAIGYLGSSVLPFKLGDLLRVIYAGSRMKNGKTLSLSTVLVDRYLDVLSVGLIFAGLTLGSGASGTYRHTTLWYMLIAACLLLVTFVVYAFKDGVKRLIRAVAGIFAPHIEEKLLKVSWALIWNFKDILQKIDKLKMALWTALMWGLYILSYALFANGAGGDGGWKEVFTSLFASGAPLSSLLRIAASGESGSGAVYMSAFMVLPALIFLLASCFFKGAEAESLDDKYLQLFPHLDGEERRRFLESYFSGESGEYMPIYLKINQNISIIRDYSAGSNATTMLCTDGSSTFYRKYAFGAEGEKLKKQVAWMEEHSGELSLAPVQKKESGELYCFYDMPYQSGTCGLFEYIHSMPLDSSKAIIFAALKSLEDSIYKSNVRAADEESVGAYIDRKVFKNLGRIRRSRVLRGILGYEELIINGRSYKNLSFYDDFLSESHLMEIFGQDEYAVIHGDLTVENIVCVRQEGKDGFYLIDPNGGNIHESPNLDHAKLLQSLHGGYEFFMATKSVRAEGGRIEFMYTGSLAYKELYGELKRYMEENFSPQRIRSIYFHEIVHWLRLMPYKLERGDTGLIFYAAFLMALDDIYRLYGKNGE